MTACTTWTWLRNARKANRMADNDSSRSQWIRVTRREPCKICGKPDYCTRSADGVVSRCMRIESDRPSQTGGWIHRLSEPLPQVTLLPKMPGPKRDAPAIARACCAHIRAPAKRCAVAEQLGVSVAALEDLGVGIGFDHDGREWASFPVRGAKGEIVGVIRRYSDGAKKTVAGTSNAGIFCKPYWWLGNGTVYVVEGPSDVAAMIDAGLSVLGRPSNVGGIPVLSAYLRRHAPKRIVVVGENDAKPERRGTVQQCPRDCAGCAWCWPGRFGAIVTADRLGRALRRRVEVAMPPDEFKDARQWWLGNGLAGIRDGG